MSEHSSQMLRNSQMTALQTFPFYEMNKLDRTLDDMISKASKQIRENIDSNESWEDLMKNNHKEFLNKIDQYGITESDIDQQITGNYLELTFIEDEIQALAETKILFASKHFEISIKRLLNIAYQANDTRSFTQWKNWTEFLAAKGINIKTLPGYPETNALRLVNNAIKHSIEKDESLNTIPEFKDKEGIYYNDIIRFYKRIQYQPQKFLESLAEEIFDELFIFDDMKIKSMTKIYQYRMDKETSQKFCDELMRSYKH